MADNLPRVQVPDGTVVRVAILVEAPATTLLFSEDPPSRVLRSKRADAEGIGHFRQHYPAGQSLEELKAEIQERWPGTKIFRQKCLGYDTPQKWE